MREPTSDGEEKTVQDVDEPAVLQNFSATLMEDSVGCVQVPFFGFFAFSRYTEEKMVDCCMIFFPGFPFPPTSKWFKKWKP